MTYEATELKLYVDNTSDVYVRHLLPNLRNLAKKWRKGVYDHEKALKAFQNVATAGAKMYAGEHDDVKRWNHIFPASVRNDVAESLRADFESEMEAGNDWK